MDLDRAAPLDEAAGVIDRALADLGAVASAARHGDQLAAVVVDAHAAGMARLVELAGDASILTDDPDLAELLWVQGDAGDPGALAAMAARLDTLRGSIEQSGVPGLLDAADRLIEALVALYGWALERAVERLHDSGQTEALTAAVEDPVVGALLLAHGMYPESLADRVRHVLAACAETLGDNAGHVELAAADEDTGHVRLVVSGGDEQQRWRTRLAVERAIRELVADVVQLDVDGAEAEPRGTPGPAIIPLTSIGRRRTTRWAEIPSLATLADGEVLQLAHDGVALVACRVGTDVYVARDPFATDSLRMVDTDPPTVEAGDGTRFAFTDPLPTHVDAGIVEVLL